MEKARRNDSFVMRSHSFPILILVILLFIITTASFAFSQTSQYQSIKGVKFKDGTIIRGQVVQLSTDTVTVKTPDGNTFVRKFDEVDTFIKDDSNFVGTGSSSSTYGSSSTSAGRFSNYFVLKAGGFFPSSGDLDDFDSGFNGEIALGFFINPNLAIELGFGYFETEAKYSGFTSTLGNYTETDKLQVKPITLSLKAIYPVDKLELYGLAGIGAYFIRGEIEATSSRLGFLSLSDDDVAFGAHVGVGMQFNITPNVFLGVEGKYVWTQAEFSAYGINLDVDIGGFIVTGNFGFKF